MNSKTLQEVKRKIVEHCGSVEKAPAEAQALLQKAEEADRRAEAAARTIVACFEEAIAGVVPLIDLSLRDNKAMVEDLLQRARAVRIATEELLRSTDAVEMAVSKRIREVFDRLQYALARIGSRPNKERES